ncbi:hypothetical protein, partial [Clostridium sp. UBA4548]|uniref:hypothetical protein n=1 Tax=Clostridium sp. UBA4548 TaxID=1946361 RepID=UPI0025BE9804
NYFTDSKLLENSSVYFKITFQIMNKFICSTTLEADLNCHQSNLPMLSNCHLKKLSDLKLPKCC